jgi:hypothetical protein
MYSYSKILKLTLLLLSLTWLGCSSDDGGCKVDFDCPGAEICVETKCVLAVCTSNSDCVDPAYVCELNQCVLGNPPVLTDVVTPPEDQIPGPDEGTIEDTATADITPPEDLNSTPDTGASEDIPVIEDGSETEDVNETPDIPETADQSVSEDTDTIEDTEEADDTNEPGDEGEGTDEGFSQCGEINIAGCCAGNKAFTCGLEGLDEIDCNLDGSVCGWAGGFYGCNTDGLADPDGTHPFTCPGESCEASCEGKACGTNGCGSSCGVCEGGLECVPATGQCIEIDEGPEVFYFGEGGAQLIFMTYCVGCHSGGGAGGHNIASNFDDAASSANAPQCVGMTIAECSFVRMSDGSMPPTPTTFEPEELTLIENWVNGGALEDSGP